jgi:hypothetical protein
MTAVPSNSSRMANTVFPPGRDGSVVTREDGDRWEYKVLRPSRDETKKEASDPESDLNELADDGWRFVQTVDYAGGGTKYMVFERPAASDAGADEAEPDHESRDDSR